MSFHVNYKGEAGKCSATTGNCPFGGEADHFATAEAARAAYEQTAAEHFMMEGMKKALGNKTPEPKTAQPQAPVLTSDEEAFEKLRNKGRKKAGQSNREYAEQLDEFYSLAQRLKRAGKASDIRKEVADIIKTGVGPSRANEYYKNVMSDFTAKDWAIASHDWDDKKRESYRKVFKTIVKSSSSMEEGLRQSKTNAASSPNNPPSYNSWSYNRKGFGGK